MNNAILDTVLSVFEESKNDICINIPLTTNEVLFKVSTFRGTIEIEHGLLSKKIIQKMEKLLQTKLKNETYNKRFTHALQWSREKNEIEYLHYIEDDLLPL